METRREVGQRVTRPLFMDDGTWRREGDECLSRSPLRTGEVVAEVWNPPRTVGDDLHLGGDWVYTVRWDDGELKYGYLWHGIDPEVPDGNG